MLMAHSVRIITAGTVGLNLALALVTPVFLPVLFGSEFRGAVPMALILFAAQVPLAGATVLTSALQADGAPLIPTGGELIALLITIVGLAALLGPLGGIGAAIVSLAAYLASFVFQVVMARRRTGIPMREFLVPSRADVRWARGLLSSVSLRPRAAA